MYKHNIGFQIYNCLSLTAETVRRAFAAILAATTLGNKMRFQKITLLYSSVNMAVK